MDETTVEALCDELRQLIKLGPGVNEHGLRRVRAIVADFHALGGLAPREKAAEVLEDFEMWFTPRRWQRFGDHAQFTMRLHTSIQKLSIAAGTWLHASGTRSPS